MIEAAPSSVPIRVAKARRIDSISEADALVCELDPFSADVRSGQLGEVMDTLRAEGAINGWCPATPSQRHKSHFIPYFVQRSVGFTCLFPGHHPPRIMQCLCQEK